MFTKGIPHLSGSSLDPANLAVPRPFDALQEECGANVAAAMTAEDEFLSFSERVANPDAYRQTQLRRRRQLESFLWTDANSAQLRRMLDLICAICEELCWSASDEVVDDPAHPEIDVQAAETGMLLAWILRRHGSRLKEISPRIPGMMLGEVRRRLLSPICAHDDYPFMRDAGRCPALIICDLLTISLLMERVPTRRLQPVRILLRLLDEVCARTRGAGIPLEEKLTDACAIADLARLLKRVTRGELDFTQEAPPETWLDEIVISWAGGDAFFDPAGSGTYAEISGMDVFRLGYLVKDRALCALGAQLNHSVRRESRSVTGRVLSMEYMRAMQDETASPPRLKRAVNADASLMVSRCGGFTAAICTGGGRANAGDVCLLAGSQPILIDFGGDVHSLPMPDGRAVLVNPKRVPPLDNDFSDERDIMSAELTGIFPDSFGVNAYQRTLMMMRLDGCVRLVDAMEFSRQPDSVVFRFVTAPHPIPLRDRVLLGPVTLRWDGEMTANVSEENGCHILTLTMPHPPRRMICGFSFEMN